MNQKKKSHPFWKFFWLTFLVVSLAYAWYSFYTPENNIEWISYTSMDETIQINSNKPILLFFTGKWCSPCRIMKREVFTDKRVERTINEYFDAVLVDVDNPDSQSLVKRFKVIATPTIVILDSKGELLVSMEGKISKTDFLELLQKNKP
ncbi:thioredoxin family protein [Mangrovimonas cancribranchiae]|uniref:Thioredoxin fold domain-containing protein n=1 Tax=Mangrovimonas cancribranchiae TaxID=3080055 RepID=A0AAU6P0D7_9FLAO